MGQPPEAAIPAPFALCGGNEGTRTLNLRLAKPLLSH